MQDESVGKRSKSARRLVVTATIGNALEFFDFTVYSFFAIVIGKLFFSPLSGYGQLLASVATFGIGFVMRPLGGIVIGSYADRYGRKAAMTITIMLMALGSAMLGLCPTYDQIGILAPVLIVIARLVQGFSAGGEVGATTALLVEHANTRNRGYLGSWQFASQGLGALIGGCVAWAVMSIFSVPVLEQWAWRIPFLLGVLIAPVGILLRMQTDFGESSAKETVARPLSTLFGEHRSKLALGVLLTIGSTVSAYIITFYLPTYAIRQLHIPASGAMLSAVVSGAVILCVSPLAGLLSDRLGRKTVIFWPRVALVCLTYPAFAWLSSAPSTSRLLLTVGGLTALLALQTAPAITMLPEMFHRSIRATGMAVVYSIGVAIFGGFAQLIVTWLIQATGDPLVPAYYVMAGVVLSCFALPFIKDMSGQALDDGALQVPPRGAVEPLRSISSGGDLRGAEPLHS